MTSQQRIKAARERMSTEAAKAKFIAGLPSTAIPEILEAREELKAYDGKDFLSIYNSKLNGVPGKIQKRLSPKNAEDFKRAFENSFVPPYVGQVQQIGILIEETHTRITKAISAVREKEKIEETRNNYFRGIDSKFSDVPYDAHVKVVHPAILARQKIDREHHDAHDPFHMTWMATERRLYASSDTLSVMAVYDGCKEDGGAYYHLVRFGLGPRGYAYRKSNNFNNYDYDRW